MGSELATGFQCSVCGLHHAVLPLSFSVKAPLAVTAVPPPEFNRRVVITADQCVIDDRFFYLRGRVVVPILGWNEPFIWGVWAEVSPRNFRRAHELWKSAGREAEPLFRGYLNTELPLYGKTLNLEVDVETQRVGRRPHFRVVEQQHPLAVEQREGISMERVESIAALLLHSSSAD